MIEIPVLHTDRLILRGFATRDEEPYLALMADPEVILTA